MHIRPLDLGVLCRMLRAAGLHVTAVHELRLQTVFRTFEDVPEDRVVRLVAPVVMSAPEELEIVEDVVARWLPEVAALRFVGPTGELALVQPTNTSQPVGQAAEAYTAAPSTRRSWLPWVVAAAVVGGVLTALLWQPGVAPRMAVDAGPPPDVGPTIAETQPAAVRPTGTYPGPTLVVEGQSSSSILPFSLLFLVGLGSAVTLFVVRRRRPGLPTELPPPAAGGVAPPRRPTPLPELVRLTDVGDQNALVWGVDHYLSESTGSRIDLAQSVRATARAGERPVVVWSQERVARAIWLWLDADAETEAVAHLAEEIRTTLVANGLDVHVAWFAGLPDRLYLEREVILPEDLPTPPQEAVVAVLTDGLALLRIESGLVATALRALQPWPRLAVVDFARGATDLPLRMRPYAIQVLEPEGLARWLGGEAAGGASVVEVDLTPWLCALALSPTPVDPADALALGARLGVDHPARHLTDLAQDAHMVGGRLTWPWDTRALRLDWLVRQPDLLEISLDFWKQRHAQGPGDTAVDRARAVERAWLTLFTDPVEAAPLLFAEPSQRAWIEEHLRGLDVADAPARDGVVRLGWTWADVPPLTRVMLQARGFAGQIVAPVRPERPWKAIAVCATAMVVGVVGLLWPGDPGPPEVVLAADAPWGAEVVSVDGPREDGRYTVTVNTIQDGDEVLGIYPAAGDRATVTWTGAQRDCVRQGPTSRHLLDRASKRAELELERWFCTESGLVPPFQAGERHAVIGATPEAPGAAALARKLLDLGVVVEVIFDPALSGEGYHRGTEEYAEAVYPRAYWVVAAGAPCDTPRLRRFAFCVPGELQALADPLGGEARPLLEVWPQATGAGAAKARLPGQLDRILRICLDLSKNPDGVAELECALDDTCIQVGNRLSNGGRGITADPALAARVRQRACEAGRADGCNDLGYQYAMGKGVAQSLAEAARLYRRACDAGHGMACSNLATLYLPGNNGNSEVGGANTATAIELFRKACDVVCTRESGPPCRNGQAAACTHLGRIYGEGKLVPRDATAALGFLQKGCAAGNEAACKLLRPAPETVAPATVAPATVAPKTVAPATVAPKTVAPATVAPATVAPAMGEPKVWELRGKYVVDSLIEPKAPISNFAATMPEVTRGGVRQVLTGVPAPPDYRKTYGSLILRMEGDKMVVELRIEPPAPQLLPVLRATKVGNRVRIRMPSSMSQEFANLLAQVPREIDARVKAARAAGRSVDDACVARVQREMTDKVWKALRILFEQDSDEAPELRALVAAERVDRQALDPCLGPARATDPRLAEARRQLEGRVARLRALTQTAYVGQGAQAAKRLAEPLAQAELLLAQADPTTLDEAERRLGQLAALEADMDWCGERAPVQHGAPPTDADPATQLARLEKSLQVASDNVAARPRNDLISAPCLVEADASLEEIRQALKARRAGSAPATSASDLEQRVWAVMATMRRCLGERDFPSAAPLEAAPLDK